METNSTYHNESECNDENLIGYFFQGFYVTAIIACMIFALVQCGEYANDFAPSSPPVRYHHYEDYEEF